MGLIQSTVWKQRGLFHGTDPGHRAHLLPLQFQVVSSSPSGGKEETKVEGLFGGGGSRPAAEEGNTTRSEVIRWRPAATKQGLPFHKNNKLDRITSVQQQTHYSTIWCIFKWEIRKKISASFHFLTNALWATHKQNQIILMSTLAEDRLQFGLSRLLSIIKSAGIWDNVPIWALVLPHD